MGFLFTEASALVCCIICTCGLELHTSLNNYITARGTQMVKLDHEYDYKPVLLFKYESHSHLGRLLRKKESHCLWDVYYSDCPGLQWQIWWWHDGNLRLAIPLTCTLSQKQKEPFSKLWYHSLRYTMFRVRDNRFLSAFLEKKHICCLLQ